MKVDRFGSLVISVKEMRELLDKLNDNDTIWFQGWTDDYTDNVVFGINETKIFEEWN